MNLIEFDTDWYPPEQRQAAFNQTLVSFSLTPIGNPMAFSVWTRALALQPVVLCESTLSPVVYLRDAGGADRHDHFSLTIVVRGSAEGWTGPLDVRCMTGDALLADHREPMEIASAEPSHTCVILLPRAFLHEALPGLEGSQVIRAGPDLQTIRMVTDRLFEARDEIAPGSTFFYARALRDLIVATVLTAASELPRPGRRTHSILERARRLVDTNLAGPLTPAAMCQTLGVSRSALYRAMAPVGGVQRLIRRRRLQAIYRALLDSADRRSVSAIAQDNGYTTASRFSRDFQQTYGVTARELRASKSHAQQPVASHDFQLRRLLLDLTGQNP